MKYERHTRRSFLQGQAAADELADVASRETVSDAGSESVVVSKGPVERSTWNEGHDALLVSVRRRAMACEWEVQLAASRHDDSMERVFAALDLVEALEGQMTVYRDHSDVQEINR